MRLLVRGAHDRSDLAAGEILIARPAHGDIASSRGHEAGEHVEQRRLARATRSDEADVASGSQIEGDVVEQRRVKADREVLGAEHRRPLDLAPRHGRIRPERRGSPERREPLGGAEVGWEVGDGRGEPTHDVEHGEGEQRQDRQGVEADPAGTEACCGERREDEHRDPGDDDPGGHDGSSTPGKAERPPCDPALDLVELDQQSRKRR
jgi:hypothetical protein